MENKFVINIGRQLGSGGKAVGEILAQRLNIHLYDKQLINLAAEQSGLRPEFFEKVDEKNSKGLLPTLIGYLKSPFADDEGAANNILSGEALFKIQSDVIRDLASRESCIFVGRCADYILRDHPCSVNVFITGELTDRRNRLCRLHNTTPEQAEELIRRTDSRRSSYYNYYSHGAWGEAATYHLCLNSSALGVEGTARFVLKFIEEKIGIRPSE